MSGLNAKRPAIPAQLYRPTLFGFLAYALFTFAWIPVFGTVTLRVLHGSLPLGLKLLLAVPSIVLAGHGFHMLGWFSHEGVHLTLLKSKYTNMLVGCFLAGAALFPLLGYGITHWAHHRYTNQVSDPDTKIYPQHKTFWTRFFRGRATANRGYFVNTFRVAFGLPVARVYRIPFTPAWSRFFAVFTLLSIAAWVTFYATLATKAPLVLLVCVALPWLTAVPASGLRIYLEHTDTGAGIFRDTRSYVSPIWTFIMFGNNYHLEHHLYPTVPAYFLPRVHRLLREQGVYARADSNVVHGFFAPLKFVTGKYQYPSPLLGDLEVDPFSDNDGVGVSRSVGGADVTFAK